MQPSTASSLPLFGKTALVTGASRGIGRASALALAEAGAQVLVHYGSSDADACEVVEKIRRGGGRAQKIRADLRAPEGAHVLAGRVREIIGGRLDVLVSNAGVSKSASIEDTTVDDFDKLVAVNVRTPFFLVQQLLPIMCKGSSVILMSSLVARSAGSPLAAYAATKGALDTLVRQFASTLGGKGIRVNAVAPGVIDTDLSSFTKTEAGRSKALGLQVFKRIAIPEDVASVVVFLASDAARWISGDTLRVDGGSKL
jgi:3-oxoacyl-[acyl-carrier protein] reductase